MQKYTLGQARRARKGIGPPTWGQSEQLHRVGEKSDLTMRAVRDPQVAAALSLCPGRHNMVTYEDEDDLTLHERLQQADKALRRATDDLESERMYYYEDPSDANREKVKKAKRRVREAVEERDAIFEEIAAEEEDEASAW